MLTDLQKKKFTRLFHVWDADKNGLLEKIDSERIAANIAESRGWKKGSPNYEKLLASFMYAWEANASMHPTGKIDLDAWLRVQEKMLKTPGQYDTIVKQTAEFMFDTLDADGDGKVTPKDFGTFFRCYGIDEKLADGAFKKIDLNGDGHVSKSELTDCVTQFYFSSDVDAPGNWLFGTI